MFVMIDASPERRISCGACIRFGKMWTTALYFIGFCLFVEMFLLVLKAKYHYWNKGYNQVYIPNMVYKVGVLILSDTCAKDNSLDKTTPAIIEFLNDYQKDGTPIYEVTHTAIIPDQTADIQFQITKWTSNDDLRLILTCGGTGFTIRDITPEAIKPLLEKEAPGVVHAMLSESFKITPFAMMSRPVAGVRGKSLIVTLPGSPKGARENLLAILKPMPHALAQIENEDSRALHKKMNRTLNDALPGNSDTSYDNSPVQHDVRGHTHTHAHTHDHDHHHHHHHNHDGPKIDKVSGRVGCGLARHELISNDLNAPVTQRARDSPYPMLSVNDAYKLIAEFTPQPTVVEIDITSRFFTGYTVAEDIYSPVNVPNFRASIVDGYAVHSSDGPGTYPVVSISHASSSNTERVLQSGQISRVTTGAPIPEGSDAVIMVEETQLVELTADGQEEKSIKILATGVKADDNVREIGSDLKKGTLILPKGASISSSGGEVGLLASVGIQRVKVYAKPKIGILSTGDELKNLENSNNDVQLSYGEIHDSNRPTLLSCATNTGFESIDLGIASDSKHSLEELITKAFNDDSIDYLVTTGGVSMGEKDLLKPTIERVLNGTIHFGRVKMKPGKPTTFATVQIKGKTKVIFALPGNPASATVCYNVFVLPSLYLYSGMKAKSDADIVPLPPKVKVKLQADTRLDPRPEYQRVHISQSIDTKEGTMELIAISTGFQRSSRIGSFKGANGLLCLPSSNDVGVKSLGKGELVDAFLIGPLYGY